MRGRDGRLFTVSQGLRRATSPILLVMGTLSVVVAAHGHCFDGLMSAAMFTHLRRSVDRRPLSFRYRSCGYGPNMQTVPEKWLNGDENAIVDFRYAPSTRLTWYFDHHITAFASDSERDDALAKSKRFFYDPDYGSCTKLIADVGRELYGVSFERFDGLVAWADKIDSAGFASAADAADRAHPIKQLAGVVEQHGDAPLFERLVPELLDKPLEDVASGQHVQSLWEPIRGAMDDTHSRIAHAMQRRGNVVLVDVHETPLASSGKFVAYSLAPECAYSVALIRMRQHYKISVGFNPWAGKPRHHDIGRICQRFGGGGHPFVGAVSVAIDKLDEARRIVQQIVEELSP